MSKSWSVFSILVVFALLILLAPVAILAPPQNVAQAQGGVVQEVEANFTFNETDPGEWWPFTAGSTDIDPKGLCLEQYSREHVVKSVALADCGFRNYTAGSGTASGNLSGTIWVSWLTFNFSEQYSHAPLYHDYGVNAHFGWMAGRGHFDAGGGNNFTFVFALDWDSDATMTNADGKGFMLSVNETGSFAGHKIIGDFEVLIENGSDYTWNLHLRSYDPSEVHYLGIVDVVGQVLQEPTDPIRYGLDLLSFDSDDAQPTQTANHTTDFEEITWGREPMKNVTGGPMGAGGLMDLSRNNALYLHIDINPPAHPGETWVGIQGTPVCNLHIDDSIAQTGNDGSIYGEMWYLLLLDLPFQYMKMLTPPVYNYFNQTGYTFTPFGLTNASTDWYSGRENYADAFIQIEATSGTAHQVSTDDSYGLYPHPKVDSVTSNSGYVGETLDVTISGKYFLRAAGPKSGLAVPNSGSVDFGPNITVNSYTINTNNPIDNTITARITISPTAGAGTEVVNVTSCFGYSAGNGAAPYLSGLGAFTVKALEGATLQAEVSYAGGLYTQGLAPTRVKLFEAGTSWNTDNLTWNGSTITDTTGTAIISNLDAGDYDIAVKGPHSLSATNTSVTLNSIGVAGFIVLEGDVNDDDSISGSDFGIFKLAYGSYPGCPKDNWNSQCDFNWDDSVSAADFGIFKLNYGEYGTFLFE